MKYIIGADEVGRGCLAGAVYVCGGAVPQTMQKIDGVDDSKKLSAKKRESLSPIIQAASGTYWTLANRDAKYIDQHGIVNAVRSCFQEVVEKLLKTVEGVGHETSLIRIDGSPLWDSYKYETPTQFIVKGDALEWVIGAASIVAKVARDQYIADLGKQYPNYGWAKNAGYGTKDHTTAIQQHGLTPYHRATFCRAFTGNTGQKLFEDDLSDLFGG